MTAIIGWVTGKIAGPVFLALAIVLGCATAIQTVRINGISVFGWYAIDGYKPQLDQARKEGATYRANASALDAGLTRCNASVDDLAAQGRAATAEAQAAMAKLQAAQAMLSDARRRLAAVPGSKATCPTVDAIFKGAFGQ